MGLLIWKEILRSVHIFGIALIVGGVVVLNVALFSLLFTGVRGEAVWKIAEGVSTALLWRQEAADRDSFGPSWPL